MTVGAWLAGAEAALGRADACSPRLEAQLLAACALSADRLAVLAHPEREIDDAAAGRLLARRLGGEPLAYLLGWREFYGRRFAVGPAVLIPRQETETLVEVALAAAARGARALDVCSGSGCVGISLKLERPDLRVELAEVSPAALAVAAANAKALGAEVELLGGDLFAPAKGRYGLVVSNPPYVASGDALPVEVAEFEPALALFGGADGLDLVRRLVAEAPARLEPGGVLALEFGDGQEERVKALFAGPRWEACTIARDLDGRPRVARARLSG